MMDVIEHISDPVSCIQKAFSNLKPGGALILYTPNHSSPIVKLARLLFLIGFEKPIQQIFANNHISFFSPRSVKTMLKNKLNVTNMCVENRIYDPRRPHVRSSLTSQLLMTIFDILGKLTFVSTSRFSIYIERPNAY